MTTLRRRPLVPHAMPCGLFLLAAVATATAQCPPTRIVSPEGERADRFGGSIASNAAQGGAQWAIEETNQVWAYEMVDGQLEIRQQLRAPAAYLPHLFGSSMDMDGDRLVVGVYSIAWPDRAHRPGGAIVYDLVDGRWVPAAEIRPPLDMTSEGTGGRVAVRGDTIFAGGGTGTPIIVYEPVPGEPDRWAEVQRLEGPYGILWGQPIVPAGDWLFVGAQLDHSVERFGGSVYVYRLDADGLYQQVQKIDGPSEVSYPIRQFGASVDCDGDTLAIGALGASPTLPRQGAVYVYELDGDRWTQRQTLTNHDADGYDSFGGIALRVQGDRLLAHASGERAARSDGMAYAFERTASGHWRQSARLLPSTPRYADQYGVAMAMHGDRVLVGANTERLLPTTDPVGAAYLFDLSCYECPDLDADDRLTVFDYLEFLRAFDAGEAIADMDNDGELTIFDFLAFQDAFAVGCP